MKLVPILAATVAFATLAATPAAAQHRHHSHGWGGRGHGGWSGHRHGWYGHHRHAWGYRRPCRWLWRHHHRVWVCW